MSIYEKLISKQERLAVVGLGYVGLPLAIAFEGAGLCVIGFDINSAKIDLYKNGVDPTKEIDTKTLKSSTINWTSNPTELKSSKFIIVAVPTPVNSDNTPNLEPVISACQLIGNNLDRGTIVVFESTVYPGCTENICIPILEKQSGLKCGKDFKVGYSPERINIGDKLHTLQDIRKIISGCDEEALQEIKNVYNIIIKAGTFSVSNIKTAEAIKVVENSQRDINIAFMNEIAMAFDKMGIDTNEVIDGMNTKWNALGFRPGLVGGHCIGVDPYYFIYQAENLGYHSQIILNGRIINDSIGHFIAQKAVQKMILAGQIPHKSKVAILGLTFKENCCDIRNSKVNDIIKELNRYGISPQIVDPYASNTEAQQEYGITLTNLKDVKDVDCIIIAVAHDYFTKIDLDTLKKLYDTHTKQVLIDVKGIYKIDELNQSDMLWWRL